MNDQTTPAPELPKRGRFAVNDPKWCFRLHGNDFWLWNLVRDFNSVDIDLFADHEDDRPTVYYMTSPHLTGLTAVEATARAGELLVLFNGMLQLNEGFGFQPFRLGDCVERETMRRAFLPYGERALMKAYPDNVNMLRYLVPRRPLDYFGQVLFLARSDAQVHAMLRILGTHGITLGSLSQVLDTVEGALREQFSKEKDRIAQVALYGGKKAGDLKNFTYTANSFAVSGVDARHGLDEKFGVTDKLDALSLDQAADVVLSCARGFVKERMTETFPVKFREVLIASRIDAY